MIDENNEYEIANEKETPSCELPLEIMKRFEKHSERTGDDIEEVKRYFFEFIATDYGCDDWSSEDEDLLIDWAEQCFVQLRRGTAGGGVNTVPYVGCFVGVDANKRDRRENMRKRAIRDFTLDPNAAVSSGRIGVYVVQDKHWVIDTTGGRIDTGESADDSPSNSFMADGKHICLLGSASGRPMPSELIGRHYYFLGNSQDSFAGHIQLWRVDMVGDLVDLEVKIGYPCRIAVRPPSDTVPDAWKDVLGSTIGMTIEYTDEFVDEDMRSFLHPHKFWLSEDFHDLYTPLEEMIDAYNAKSRTFEINGEQGRAGPIILTKGTVNRLSTEPRESDFDQTGRNFSFNLTSMGLQNIHGSNRQSDVSCWVSGSCHDLSNPFVAYDVNTPVGWAEKSTVLVCGRIGMSVIEGETIPKLNVFGVFADIRRIRKRRDGGDMGASQFD